MHLKPAKLRILNDWGGEQTRYPLRFDFLAVHFLPSSIGVSFSFNSFCSRICAYHPFRAILSFCLTGFVVVFVIVVVHIVLTGSARNRRNSLEKTFSFCRFHSSMARTHTHTQSVFLLNFSMYRHLGSESPSLHKFYLITICVRSFRNFFFFRLWHLLTVSLLTCIWLLSASPSEKMVAFVCAFVSTETIE